MTDQPADTLRAAAQRLRELADAATPGPWRYRLYNGSDQIVAPDQEEPSGWYPVVGDALEPPGEKFKHYMLDEDAALIAALGPDFARAVAAWFDAEAGRLLDDPRCLCGECHPNFTSPALAVATQILDRSDT